MNKGLIVVIIGILLIVAAAVGVGFLIGNTVKDVKKYQVEAHSTYNVTYSLKGNRDYLFLISSEKIIHYKVIAPNGTKLDEGNTTNHNFWINTTADGKYLIQLQNPGNDTVSVTVVKMYKKSIETLATGILWLGAVCIIGIILIIVGIILAVVTRKKG